MKRNQRQQQQNRRRGAIAVLTAVLALPMVGLISFAVDYGYVLVVRTQMQRAADAGVLAAVQELAPDADGNQDLEACRTVLRQYVNMNVPESLNVPDSDIQIGRFDPTTVYSTLGLFQDGTLDTVQVTLRRDGTTNPLVPLYFARLIGVDTTNVTVTATAVLQKARYLPEGTDILPFAVSLPEWEAMGEGTIWNIYGDGRVEDQNGNPIPGNWGTVDVGSSSNSSSDLNDQILNGLRQLDLDNLQYDGRIDNNEHIDSQEAMWVQGDTGLSSGLKQSILNVYKETKVLPLYDVTTTDGGNNLEFHIVGWGVVQVVNSVWAGEKNTHVDIQQGYLYDGDLRAQPDLSDTLNVIPNAYTSPVLIR